MPRRQRNIYKRTDGRWEGRYIKEHINGKAKYGAVYGHSYSEVKDKLAYVKENLEENVINNSGTISAIGNAWLSEARIELKESTINKYEDIMHCYIFPEFGNCKLSDITNENLIDFSKKLILCGGTKKQGLSKSTVMEVMSVMNSMRIYALRRDCIVRYSPECINIKKDSDKIRVFSVDEEATLIKWLCNNFDLTALTILLSLFTGIRIGEVCALKWDDFNFSEGVFFVNKTMQRVRIKNNPNKKSEVKIIMPKSDCSIRSIPIPENIKELLNKNYIEGAFITTGNKVKFVEPRTLANRFKSILKKAGIADAGYHCIRHSFATRCVEQGVDIKCLSEILGHASVSITLNRYVHPSINLKAQNLKRMTKQFPIEQLS